MSDDEKYPHNGYMSVAGRGEYGHWDITDGKRRVFVIRGDAETGFILRDERKPMSPFAKIEFSTPFEALEYAALQLIETP